MRRQVQFIQEALHFVQVQARDVLRPAVLDNLTDIPLALEWIGQIEPVGAPDESR
jgi:hypothetical protein